MEKFLIGLGLSILVVAATCLFGLLFGWIVMLLWNALLPMIFGVTAITYWQGVGIYILSNLLFKSSNTNTER
jgi:hypothetical protein